MGGSNDEAIEAWNTILFDKFVEYRHVLAAGLAQHGTRAMDRCPPRRGAAVVDIGCGFGDTTAELARRVGPQGSATGVDAAERFIASARAEHAGIANARFEVCDIERGVSGGPYELAFSRMGTMFFASPVIALRHIRKVLVPGGKLCMVVWRKKDANEWLAGTEAVIKDLLGDPDKGEQVTCGPGPFSMASADLVSDQLVAAGFRDPVFERSDANIVVGRDIEDAIRLTLAIGPSGEVMRLAGEAAITRRAEIEAAVRRVIEGWELRPDAVAAPSSTWIVTATA
jgi:SAM-dependent methyltransferase